MFLFKQSEGSHLMNAETIVQRLLFNLQLQLFHQLLRLDLDHFIAAKSDLRINLVGGGGKRQMLAR
jgi:hypothetical protein